MKNIKYQKKLRWLFIIVVTIFILSLLHFSKIIISEIKKRETSTIERYAKFIELVTNNEYDLVTLFADDILIENHTIPVIITDKEKNIIEHKNILNEDSEGSKEKIMEEFSSMHNQYEPIKINIYDSKGDVIDYQFIYYKNSQILDIIIVAPYFISALIILILLSIYLILYYSNKSEKDQLWTGLAKETAHQLGTPLSSLIAWNEYIKSKSKIYKKQASSEVEKDLKRLKIITDRFSGIGSKPKLKKRNLKNIIFNNIDYLKKRISSEIKTNLNLDEVDYEINEQLFGWVIENLYKNSIDAVGKNGKINIKLFEKNNKIIVEFTDSGIGIKKTEFKKIFNPGYTTKTRGWGLGLALAYRIISHYHKGIIYVKESIKNIKTTIRIELMKQE
ncbi:MAG: HAMP domain-containing sensor histidine kinase [Cytophagales bacterium]|nr:HAMP domain-containing sensor histidine kinase [Cytophagales bacterium]